MATRLRRNSIQARRNRVFEAACWNETQEILDALKGLSADIIWDILHYHSSGPPSDLFNHHTPLSVAVASSATRVVKLLVETFGVDIEKCAVHDASGNVREPVLSVAASNGYLKVVKCLVRNGANINDVTFEGRTALHKACNQRHLSVAAYLLGKGARTNIPDKEGKTCLSASCENGYDDVVSLLLNKGADPNHRGLAGSPLDFAIKTDSAGVVRLLLRHGARIMDGRALLIQAALQTSINCLELFLTLPAFSRQDKVDGLELFGALCGDSVTIYSFLRRAMLIRYEDPAGILLKPHRPPVAALGNVAESQTVEALEARQHDQKTLQIESLLVTERILGPDAIALGNKYLEFVRTLDTEEAVAACIYVISHFTWNELHQNFSKLIARHFLEMLISGASPLFTDFKEVLHVEIQKMEEQTKGDQQFADGDEGKKEWALTCTVHIWGALQVIDSDADKEQLHHLAWQLIRVTRSLLQSSSLLHIGVEQINEVPEIVDEEYCDCSIQWVMFLLDSGADVNAKDKAGNTPLHTIACWNGQPENSTEAICAITSILLQAGAHVDARNDNNETPLDMAVSEKVKATLREYYPLPLQCLAASAVKQYGIPFQGEVSETLEDILKDH